MSLRRVLAVKTHMRLVRLCTGETLFCRTRRWSVQQVARCPGREPTIVAGTVETRALLAVVVCDCQAQTSVVERRGEHVPQLGIARLRRAVDETEDEGAAALR